MNNLIQHLNIKSLTNGLNEQWETYDYYASESINDILHYFPMRPNVYQLAICISGWLKGRIDGKEYTYGINSFAAIVPTSVVEVIDRSDDYRCISVIFTRDFLLENKNNTHYLERFKMINHKGIPYLELAQNQVDSLVDLFKKVSEKVKDRSHQFRRGIVRSLTLTLLYELENIYSTTTKSQAVVQKVIIGKDRVLANFQDLVQKNFLTERSVKFYAEQLNISTKYLSQILKELIGKGAKEVINEAILTEAKMLLRTGNYNISEVSNYLNYNNIEEFSRFFKKCSGMTPSRYKQLN